MKTRKDLTGLKFGKLTVIKLANSNIPNKPFKWECLCECGQVKSIRGTALTNGKTISCGCFNKENNYIKPGTRSSLGKGKFVEVFKDTNIKKLNFKDFCKTYGLSDKLVRNRIRKGWLPDRALKEPVDEDFTKRARRNRQKGKSFEKLVAGTLRKIFSQFSDEEIRATNSSSPGIDIRMTPDARKVIPLSIECKNYNKIGSYELQKALEQAVKNKYPNTLPCAVFRELGWKEGEALIAFNFQEFTEFWAERMGFPQEKTDNNLPDRDFEIAQEWSRLDAKS